MAQRGRLWALAGAEAGAVEALEGRRGAERDRPGARPPGWLDPRRRGGERWVRAGTTPAILAGALVLGARGDQSRARRQPLAPDDRPSHAPVTLEISREITQGDAIAAIDQGRWGFYVERPAGEAVNVVIATSRYGNKYL